MKILSIKKLVANFLVAAGFSLRFLKNTQAKACDYQEFFKETQTKACINFFVTSPYFKELSGLL